ncbi:MAG: alpha/beta fold hydrolase [Bacillota bacterium]
MPYFEHGTEKVFFVDKGIGAPVLLLPGNTASSAVYASEIDFFSQFFRVICPDYPGCGKSGRISDLPEDFWWYNARVCTDLIGHLNIDSYTVVGSSGGGIIALIMAVISGNSVRCAIAESIPGEFPNSEDLKSEVKQRETPSEDLRVFWEIAHGEDWQQVVEFDSRLILKAADSTESIYRGRLNEINCPVLLTGSLSDDSISNVETGLCSIARRIKNSKVVLFPEGNHPLMWSMPDQFRAEAVRFINEKY